MDLDAFILIGGRSSRFGTDKAFVEFGGESLAGRTARVIRTGLMQPRITLVAGREDQFPAGLLFDLGLPVVIDLRRGFGAWSGLHTALSYALGEWAFVLACDLPFVSSELLQFIANAARDDVDAVVPRQQDGRLQPLCAFYRVQPCRDAVEEVLAGQGTLPSLASFFDQVKTRVIMPEEYERLPNASRLFLNINTPDDLRSASLE